jgi:hypothetical protein
VTVADVSSSDRGPVGTGRAAAGDFSPQAYFPFFTFAWPSFGASPSEQNLILQYYSSNAGDTTKIKDARLLAIRADAADQYATTDAIDNNGGDTRPIHESPDTPGGRAA